MLRDCHNMPTLSLSTLLPSVKGNKIVKAKIGYRLESLKTLPHLSAHQSNIHPSPNNIKPTFPPSTRLPAAAAEDALVDAALDVAVPEALPEEVAVFVPEVVVAAVVVAVVATELVPDPLAPDEALPETGRLSLGKTTVALTLWVSLPEVGNVSEGRTVVVVVSAETVVVADVVGNVSTGSVTLVVLVSKPGAVVISGTGVTLESFVVVVSALFAAAVEVVAVCSADSSEEATLE